MTDRFAKRNPIPTGAFPETGFGLSPTHRNLRTFRRDTVSLCLSLADGTAPLEATPKTLEALTTTASLFASVHLAERPDWFTVHKQFGQPSGRISRQIAERLDALASDLKAGTATNKAFAELDELAFREMLDNYLKATAIEDVTPHPAADGWAYVLWSSSEPDLFVVDATDLTVEEAISETESRPAHPYGVVGAWQIDDFEAARTVISEALAEQCLDGNVYHLERPDGSGRLGLSDLTANVEKALEVSSQLFLSPWHVDATVEPSKAKAVVAP